MVFLEVRADQHPDPEIGLLYPRAEGHLVILPREAPRAIPRCLAAERRLLRRCGGVWAGRAASAGSPALCVRGPAARWGMRAARNPTVPPTGSRITSLVLRRRTRAGGGAVAGGAW
jgi:hypothetical protein